MRKPRAFTLVELLIVVAVIAILVALLTPTMGRAKDLARRAVCSERLSNHGKSIAAYVAQYHSYPHFAPIPWDSPAMLYADGTPPDDGLNGWAKFYGVLEINGFIGVRKTTYGNWYYDGPINQIWEGALCPAMDSIGILTTANHAGNFPYDGNFMYWTWFHKWAIGYQWSPFLRAATPNHGRDPPSLQPFYVDRYQWIIPGVTLPDGTRGWTQAVNPGEIASPDRCAEAWDTWDLDSAPGIDWWNQYQAGRMFIPGWHGGVTRVNAKALFNGARHKGCPSILYADGHVAHDATSPIDPQAEGLSQDYFGLKAFTWNHFDPTWGNLDYLIPRTRFQQ